MSSLSLFLRSILLVSLFSYRLSQTSPDFAIIELSLIIIYTCQAIVSGTYLKGKFKKKDLIFWLFFFEFVLTCIFLPSFFYVFPLLFFEWKIKGWKDFFIFLLVVLVGFWLVEPYTVVFIMGICVVAAYLSTLIDREEELKETSFTKIDQLRYVNRRFKSEQAQLVELQDEKVRNALLEERKRLVGEIHDLLGHQLSSAVIQIGALEFLVEDLSLKESLRQVKEVLSSSMDNVRRVIHTERETALDLKHELSLLVADFEKAEIEFTFENQTSLSNQKAHSVVNIIREALTNINKHSNADKVILRFVELSDKWILLISDNGTIHSTSNQHGGIGLLTIEERVRNMAGTLHISQNQGFRIFITIPKN
ncbi:sensor histidine kinase [Facklamia lactis]|uniref:sensor histidine kinase n=1 Tax=Facklamia lactis TaxID=2749967 RepID=UPI0018CFA3C7|nr:histidine kinase [Facklamia lactis]MBG9980752.1 hypothetical protein [Facklamia lactis]